MWTDANAAVRCRAHSKNKSKKKKQLIYTFEIKTTFTNLANVSSTSSERVFTCSLALRAYTRRNRHTLTLCGWTVDAERTSHTHTHTHRQIATNYSLFCAATTASASSFCDYDYYFTAYILFSQAFNFFCIFAGVRLCYIVQASLDRSHMTATGCQRDIV